MPKHLNWRPILVGIALVATACGSEATKDATPTTRTSAGIAATVASYELVAGKPQRFIVGLLRDDQRKVVSFGTVKLAFAFLGDRPQATQDANVRFTKEAQFIPIPGQHLDPAAPGPRIVDGSDGTGVYRATDVTFDEAGFWGVQVEARIGGQIRAAQASFQVLPAHQIPSPGDRAPLTNNPVAGAAGVDPRAIDSRAGKGTPIPDPTLHATSIADALAAHRPLMVVISTPTYCMSRFCGPLTDSVEQLAKQYGDKMAFVHLEVWQDFDTKALNPAAAEWIQRQDGDANEPWTFVVGSDGIIKQRFDNVATDQELQDAVAALT